MSDVHREFPEATEAEIERIQIGQLLRAPAPESEDRVTLNCRNCGDEFTTTQDLAEGRGSKWTRCCAWCLADEF